MKTEKSFKRSVCPITNTLDVVGDKWTLIIIRDLFLGKRLYQEFLNSPEGISTNILADRLQRLESAGLIGKEAYQHSPTRYQYTLTEKGSDLKPVLEAMLRWAEEYIPGVERFPPQRNPET
jgi:DNA-binding HxlR family transcriptional regulator